MYQKRALFYKWFCSEQEQENKMSDSVDESVTNTMHLCEPTTNKTSLVATKAASFRSNDTFDRTYDLGEEVSLFPFESS